MAATLEHKIRQLISPVPSRVAKNFRAVPAGGEQRLRASLETHYFSRDNWGSAATNAQEYLATEEGKQDLSQHMFERLDDFRSVVIPWLCACVGLDGKRVLEIGCGTGASTVALAEQHASVVAIDIDGPSVEVTRERCRVYGVEADVQVANGAELRRVAAGRPFDLIIYMACVEHMTVPERLASLKEAWSLLPAGGSLCVVETPNRLWLHDAHTAWLPFYLWLPDELAYLYSGKSPRKPFNTAYPDVEGKEMESFQRQGRGVSYHEFELALGLDGSWPPCRGLRDYLIRRNPLWLFAHTVKTPHLFQRALRKAAPAVPRPFFEQNLDFILQKPR